MSGKRTVTKDSSEIEMKRALSDARIHLSVYRNVAILLIILIFIILSGAMLGLIYISTMITASGS